MIIHRYYIYIISTLSLPFPATPYSLSIYYFFCHYCLLHTYTTYKGPFSVFLYAHELGLATWDWFTYWRLFPRKDRFFSFSSHWLPVALNLGVGPCEGFSIMLAGKLVCSLFRSVYTFILLRFTGAASFSCLRDTISHQAS